jgi:hypothetical protein
VGGKNAHKSPVFQWTHNSLEIKNWTLRGEVG